MVNYSFKSCFNYRFSTNIQYKFKTSLNINVLTVILGIFLGAVVTLTSVGAGAIGVTALLLLYPKIQLRKIIGTDIAHAVPLTLLQVSDIII